MTGRHRGVVGVAAAVMLAGAGAALVSAAPAIAEPTGPADGVGAPVPAPASPCPGPGPVGPPGVTDVPSAFGALMNLWQQARPPVIGSGGVAGPVPS